MAVKILSTSSSNSKFYHQIVSPQKKKVSLLLGAFLFTSLFCTPKLDWIRSLPKEFPRDSDLSLGTYQRPTELKSAMGSKNFQLFWKETIHILPNHEFKKIWREWRVYPKEIVFHQVVGRGQFEKSGEWVLFLTKELNTKECQVERNGKINQKQLTKQVPCDSFSKETNKLQDHKLLYYYDGHALYPMQYESGYVEANFGIAWETDKAYTKTKLFEIAKTKYGKKEFQPHVYHHVKLD